MRPIADPTAALSWVKAAQGRGSEWTGFDPSGWEARAWILHAIHENVEAPTSLTRTEVTKIELAAGGAKTAFGDVKPPGEEWTRVRWTELAARWEVDPFQVLPGPGAFRYTEASWPANIHGPCEGSLDREQFGRLVQHLAQESCPDFECVAFYSRSSVGDFDEEMTVYGGALDEMVDLYDEFGVGPSNLWPVDRSWFVYSDWDLWGTRVSGSSALVARLLDDADLEIVAKDLADLKHG